MSPFFVSSFPQKGRVNLAGSIGDSRCPSKCNDGAFSLIELLVVVAVIGVLGVLAIPAFNSIGAARGTVDAAYKIAEAIELARSEAVARRTYVWLGLQDSTSLGDHNLRLGVVFSKDGSTNTTGANLQPLFRPLLLERVGLVKSADTGANTSRYKGASALATNMLGADISIDSLRFSNKTITFTPTGEAMLVGSPTASTGFDRQILIALRHFRGNTEVNDNDIAVVIDGSSSIPSIYKKE